MPVCAPTQVYDEPGVTRDRTYGEGFWGNHEFTVVDTGGLVFDDDPDQVFLPQIRQQALLLSWNHWHDH